MDARRGQEMTTDEKNRRVRAQLRCVGGLSASLPCGECGAWHRVGKSYRCFQCGLWLCERCGAVHWPDAAAKREGYER